MTAPPQADQPDPHMLWEQGQWEALSRLKLNDIAALDSPGTAALFVAAAHFHFGDRRATQTALRQAMDWGATPTQATSVLFAGLQNTLGRMALLLEDPDRAQSHFRASVPTLWTGNDADKTTFIRQFHEMLDLGLLPEAARTLSTRAGISTQDQPAEQAWATMLDSKVEQLNHVLSLSLEKGHLATPESGTDQALDQKTLAERHSMSQLNQDVWVLEQYGYKRDGFFVEFGATNGILLSNSYLLETAFGWSGICAEPNPAFFAQLEKNRNCIVSSDCIGGETGTSVRFITADEFGGFADYADDDMHAQKRRAYEDSGHVLDLTTISLHDFLRKHGAPRTIDYLSVDTEGSEYEILATFPFAEWDVRHITVEHNFTPMRDKISALLEENGYTRTEAKWDDWYAKTD